MAPFRPNRVLVTGVSNPLGAEVARRLAPQVPHLFGCDVGDPVSALEEMDFVHADTRLSVIGKLVRQLHIDTVVHLAVMVDSPHDERSIHETDVIGTMNLLVGCAAPSSPVRKLVVKSSQAIYGAGPNDPSFFSEDMINWDRIASGVTRDLLEMEQLVSEFALRNESCDVTVLRLGYRVSEDTSLARYLSLPIVPTFAGYDPRLQLLHEDDAAEAIIRSVVGAHPGAFNIAGAGVVLLSQAIGIMGGRATPILPPYGRWLSLLGLRMLAGVDLPTHLAEMIAFGSVMDCARSVSEFRWSPAYSSRQAMDALARGKLAELIESPSPPQEYELQVYLQQRRRREGRLSPSGAGRHLPINGEDRN
ncbi:MAG: NAD-dependent epimerase/dehydratase family protein [Chloroflexi bacterium]|nr:MAG: NAD-dependent epimerase/dehydratase family protein [Chloroflexota bacterium]TMD74504.1 MAG: NAD-dependent epimerase/dehydratase family protein [Chloroflexota bacterium]